jgi:uncharacterized protein YcsI (UPF0317 family)
MWALQKDGGTMTKTSLLRSTKQDLPVEPTTLRALIRNAGYTGNTSGLAPGRVQANLAILPADWAAEFLLFCQMNPKPCPVLAVTNPGDPLFCTLGTDVDVRTDAPRYKVFRDGVLTDEPTDLLGIWQNDLVAFAIGCSFSFEEALLEAGLRLRHHEEERNVPMFRTSLQTKPTARFSGPLVVSMRPFQPADAIRAIQVTSRFPGVHGAPVHIGRPESIGIKDLAQPDFGDAVTVAEGELPVFWACGVTPQIIVTKAKPSLFISHHPGAMLITDLLNSQLAVF